MTFQLEPTSTLPVDGTDGTLVGRVWRSDVDGPSVIALRADGCFDVSDSFPTVRDVGEARNPAAAIAGSKGNGSAISNRSSQIPRSILVIR